MAASGANFFVNKVHDFLVFGVGKKGLFVKWRMKRCCTYQKASMDFKTFKKFQINNYTIQSPPTI